MTQFIPPEVTVDINHARLEHGAADGTHTAESGEAGREIS